MYFCRRCLASGGRARVAAAIFVTVTVYPVPFHTRYTIGRVGEVGCTQRASLPTIFSLRHHHGAFRRDPASLVCRYASTPTPLALLLRPPCLLLPCSTDPSVMLHIKQLRVPPGTRPHDNACSLSISPCSPTPYPLFSTQYVIYFTAGFLLIPTGRDVVAVGYPLLPGDDKLLPAMCNGDPLGASFMWKVFGSNFVMLSIIKFIILSMGVVAMPIMIAMVCGAPRDHAKAPISSLCAAYRMLCCHCCQAAYTTVLVFLLATNAFSEPFKSKGADFTPFLGLFVLESVAWYATILM